jgi:hypothetical protein
MTTLQKERTLEFELRKPFDVLASAANRENGWVNWSELATCLQNFSDAIAPAFKRILSYGRTLFAVDDKDTFGGA